MSYLLKLKIMCMYHCFLVFLKIYIYCIIQSLFSPLQEKIQTLTAENEALKERLRAEEERRRALADKSQVKFALCNDMH